MNTSRIRSPAPKCMKGFSWKKPQNASVRQLQKGEKCVYGPSSDLAEGKTSTNDLLKGTRKSPRSASRK